MRVLGKFACLFSLYAIFFAFSPLDLFAQDGGKIPQVAGAPSGADQSFQVWLRGFKQIARKKGVTGKSLTILDQVKPLDAVLKIEDRQPEYVLSFWDYLDGIVTDNRVQRGRDLQAKHQDLLKKVSEKYGVQSRFLLAFWGLETDFGSLLGEFSTIDALATLAYGSRRSAFFTAELIHALKIIDQGYIANDEMRGSWGGAMGHVQFMPSTFARYAVDENGNGRIDIWNEIPDALGSAANYLSQIGWDDRYTWGREVQLPEGFDWSLASLKIRKPLRAWTALGVRRMGNRTLPKVDIEASLLLPMGQRGPAFMVYENFHKITLWNRSIFYALAVGHFSDRIEGQGPLLTARGPEVTPLHRKEIKEIQKFLNLQGFKVGAEDGVPGRETRNAIRNFQKSAGLPADGYADQSLLKVLRSRAEGR